MSDIRTKSLQSLAIIFVFVTFCGCTSTPKPPAPIPVETKNQEKDKYIEKVEAIVSDSASALTAVVPSLDKGNVRGLVEAQVTRLSGVSKPSVAKVEEYTRILKQNDSKAVQRDKDEASKVEAETDALYTLVELKDIELSEANARADAEFKQKVLWKVSTIGAFLFVTGVLVTAFTPRKASGVIVSLAGGLAIGSAWIFDSPWFSWIIGAGVGIAVLDILIIGIIKTYRYLRPSVKVG